MTSCSSWLRTLRSNLQGMDMNDAPGAPNSPLCDLLWRPYSGLPSVSPRVCQLQLVTAHPYRAWVRPPAEQSYVSCHGELPDSNDCTPPFRSTAGAAKSLIAAVSGYPNLRGS